MLTPPSNTSRHAAAPGQQSCPSGIIPASLLFQGSKEILIDRNGEIYRLSITKNGKLILTK
ncbi:MAG: hemin uptake protein HemP [Thiobacillaceae bacterium]